MQANDRSQTDETYAEKITEAWREVLASGARRVGGLVKAGELLNEWKMAVKASDEKKWMVEAANLLPEGLGLGKVEKLMAIGRTDELRDSSNWKILPPHISTLYALAMVDKWVGKGTLAKWLTKVIHDDISVADINALVEAARPTPKPSPVEKPPSEQPRPEKPAPPEKPFGGRDREELEFVNALHNAVNHWIRRCGKGLDDEGNELRLFPGKKLDEIVQQLRAKREWLLTADFVNGQWVPPPPAEGSPAPASDALTSDASKEVVR